MKKFIGLFAVSTLLLGACDTEQEQPNPDTYGEEDGEGNVVIETDADGNVVTEDETDTDNEDMDEETEEDDETSSEPNSSEEVETDTETVEEEESDEEDIEELDEDIRATLDQDFEEINWDDVELSRAEFDAALTEFQYNLNQDYEEDEEIDIYIDNIDFTGDTIEVTMTNNDDSEFAEMTNGFFAAFIDSFYRQLYLRSGYSDGTTQPRIIVQTTDGDVITDQEDFL